MVSTAYNTAHVRTCCRCVNRALVFGAINRAALALPDNAAQVRVSVVCRSGNGTAVCYRVGVTRYRRIARGGGVKITCYTTHFANTGNVTTVVNGDSAARDGRICITGNTTYVRVTVNRARIFDCAAVCNGACRITDDTACIILRLQIVALRTGITHDAGVLNGVDCAHGVPYNAAHVRACVRACTIGRIHARDVCCI